MSYSKYIIEQTSNEPLNEVFGLSDQEKAKKKSLAELEMSYDQKYNRLCLAMTRCDSAKLRSILDGKEKELALAQLELKKAPLAKKSEAKIKVDFLKNVITRCKVLIRKKQRYEKI